MPAGLSPTSMTKASVRRRAASLRTGLDWAEKRDMRLSSEALAKALPCSLANCGGKSGRSAPAAATTAGRIAEGDRARSWRKNGVEQALHMTSSGDHER